MGQGVAGRGGTGPYRRGRRQQRSFLTAGPRFGMTKGKIWLIVVCLFSFLISEASVNNQPVAYTDCTKYFSQSYWEQYREQQQD